MEAAVIPVVDMCGLRGEEPASEAAWRGVAEAVDDAFRTTGFLYLKNAGISQHTVERAFQASDAFFHLGHAVKREYGKTFDEASLALENYYGYTAAGAELEGEADYEHKESFDVGGRGRVFPKEVPAFEPAFLALEQELKALSLKMCALLGKSLALQDDSFFLKCCRHLQDAHIPNTTTLRALFYPEVSGEEMRRHRSPARCGAHTDYGFITFLLMQDDAVGLEVQTQSGAWIPANPIPNTILVNVADFLQLWSDDRYMASVHRVPLPKDHSASNTRKTIAYFLNPDDSVDVEALPTPFNTSRTKRTDRWNTLQHMHARSRTAYAQRPPHP